MKLVLEGVNLKHRKLIEEMARALQFRVTELSLSEEDEEQALAIAMEEGKSGGSATNEEKEDFKSWLKSL